MTAHVPPPDPQLDDIVSQSDELSPLCPKTSAATQPSENSMLLDRVSGSAMATPISTPGKADEAGVDARTKISNLLKDKEQEWTAVVEKRNGPLQLLDLPMDVLKEIVKEVVYYSLSSLLAQSLWDI